MSDTDRPNNEPGLDAPAELVNDLRQSQKQMLLVPPQIDAAALSRPRLHLAHVRDLRAHGRTPPVAPAEDLALAAHGSSEREKLAERLAPRGEEESAWSTGRTWTVILWVTLAAGAVLASWIFLKWLLTR